MYEIQCGNKEMTYQFVVSLQLTLGENGTIGEDIATENS
jgi:hypothetical protein